MRPKTARRFLNRNKWKLAGLRVHKIKNSLTRKADRARKLLDAAPNKKGD